MKVYRWVDTIDHWIAVVRPDELFDLDEIELSAPSEIGECYIKGTHIDGHRATYAYAFGKRKFLEKIAKAMIEKMPETYLQSDRAALRELTKKTSAALMLKRTS